MGVGVLAAHQPDLIPFSGFWHKMWHADVFDLAIYDQFRHPGYQNRVLMRGKWLTLPVERAEHRKPIVEVRIDGGVWAGLLVDGVVGRYPGSRFYRETAAWFGPVVQDAAAMCADRMWLFNLSLLLAVRQRLTIRTPVAVGVPPVGDDVTERLIEVCRQYRAVSYLSGRGAEAYLDVDRFEQACALRWSEHQPPTGDSILSLLMDRAEPLAGVM